MCLFTNRSSYSASLAAPDPQKRSGETVYNNFLARNFNWMTFTGYVSVMPTSIQPDPLAAIIAYCINPNPTEIGFS